MNSNLYSRVVSGNPRLIIKPVRWLMTLAGLLFLGGLQTHAQQLELYSGSGPAGNGPTSASQTSTFYQNIGTSTTFSAFTPTTSFSISFSNQQYTSGPTPGLVLGAVPTAGVTTSYGAASILAPMNAIASPLASMFTSGPNSTTGTNFDIANNYGYRLTTDVFYQLGQPLTSRNYYGDITVTFSRPVINPVLHISGMGGAYSAAGGVQGFYTELELSTADVSAGRTLTRLSGSTHFVLDGTNTKILNDNTAKNASIALYASAQQYAGSGSVQINSGGTPITSVTFRVYAKGDGGTAATAVWGENGSSVGRSFDGWLLSASLGLYTINGTVYNDANGLSDNTIVSATALNGTSVPQSSGANVPLYASLVQNGSVVQTVPVTSTGTYSFTVADSDTYNVVLTTSSSGATTATLPTGWVSTGENIGTGTGTDGPINGILPVTIASANVANANFGIERIPTAGSGSATANNSGGTNAVTVPPTAFTSTTASSDVAPGSVSSIRITSFPTNTTSLTINGTVYTASSTEFTSGTGVTVATTSAGAPSVPVLVDPTNDNNPVVISFVAVDNAGKESANTGTATISFIPVNQGYIYVHKKTLDESSSIDFSFNVSGGSTVVPSFTLNDNPTQTGLRDIGTSQSGRFWAVENATNILYYRDLGSSTWVATSINNANRVDGGANNVAWVVTTSGTITRTDGITTLTNVGGVSGAIDIGSTWDTQPYILNASGSIFRLNAAGTAFTQIGSSNNNRRIDGNPANGNAVIVNGNNRIYSVTPAGVVTDLGQPFAPASDVPDVAVDDAGNIFSSFTTSYPGSNAPYKWISGTSWGPQEVSAIGVWNMTGGLGGQLWMTGLDIYTPYANIFTRSLKGSSPIWIDDERVRTTALGNSQMIAVAPGTYTITELVPSGWDLQAIDVNDPSSNSSANLAGKNAAVTVAAGETVHLVFQNGLVNPFSMTNNCGSAYLETFGTGAVGTFGPPLAGQTGYHYRGTAGTWNGYYDVVSRSNPDWGSYAEVVSIYDHTTGNGTGRFMAVNAAYNPDEFYRRRFTNLIPGGRYSFSAWLVNLTPTATLDPSATFDIIDAATKTVLATYSTGNITSGSWTQYATSFTATSSDIDLVIKNNGPGGEGNDIGLDDISFALAAPVPPVVAVTNADCATGSTITVTSPTGSIYEYSKDGTTWQSSPAFTNTAPGSYTISARYVGSTGCVSTTTVSVLTSICGTVWNDADGSITLNGSETGTSAGTTLYVNLLNASNTVIGSTTVASDGTYALSNVPLNTSGLKLILASTATATTPGTLPTGWVNTGETAGTSNTATQGATLGLIELTTSTSVITGANFGIEQLPTPGSGSNTVANAGGTSPVTVPANTFTNTTLSTDTAPGSVTAIRITAFPTNTTSLTINGTVYTSLPAGGITVPTDGTGAPTVPILVDPTNDSNPVVFTYVAVDNAGKSSTTTGTATVNSTAAISISGQVWNDADGNVALNGSETGTNTGGTLYVNLVNSSNTIVGSTTVAANGTYSLAGVPASTTGLKLVLTNSATSTTPGPLPTGWVNTGESVGTGNTATQSTTLGQIELTTGASSITAQNFGIEQLPTPGSGSNTVANAGGTTPVTVPANTFTNTTPSTDTAPGSVTAIRITVFPSNVTSLTVNGTVYTSLPGGDITVPTDGSGNPTVPILVDPTNDANPVIITFTAIDNAGKESTTTGTATINSTLTTTIAGTVWDDVDGNVTLNGSETGTNTGATLYVNLVNGAGTVVGSTTVAANGTYSLSGVPTNVTGYKLVLTNSATSATPGTLPTGWVNTGENVDPSNTATQSTILGQIELTVGTSPITAQNFGIEHLPTPGSGANTVANAGGTTLVTVPATTFTNSSPSSDAQDTPPGSVTAIRITALPSNTTSLVINGTTYNSGNFPGGGVVVPTDGSGNPTVPISVDPTNDANPVVVPFVAIDNAGKESTTTGTATINSSLVASVSGTVWNDADGNLNLNGSETGTNTGGTLYVNLVDGSGTVVGSTTVASDGTYTLSNVPTNVTGYKLVLTNSATSSTPGPLPTGWVNTGENVGSGNTAPQSTTLGQIELTMGSTSIAAQNFGIEVLPAPGSGANTVANAGGTSPVTVPANTFTNTNPSTDTAPGSVTAIHITAFPGNVTSLTVNGTSYTPSTFPGQGVTVPTDGSGNPTVPILVDPTNDANPVVITFVAVDNAGKESSTSGTATINSSPVITVSGTVWNDADGNLALNGSETATNAGGPLYVNLVDGTGTVVGSTTVAANGSYSLSGVPANVSGYKLLLTNTASSTAPGGLPSGWVNTGENVDPSNTATQSTMLGQIELTTGITNVTAQNFGIEQLPGAGSGSNTVSNAGGTSPVSVPATTFTNSTPSTDTAPGSVTAIRLTTFPANVTSLTVNGTTYTAGSFPAAGVTVPTDGSGNPTQPIAVDPTNDANPVVIPFVAIDNAGKESPNTGTATISSSPVVTVSGTVWNDADGNLALNGSETGTNTGGTLYVNLVDGAGTVVGSTTVALNGSYSLAGVPTNVTGYKLVLTNSASSNTPGTLPTGWVNTGENVDPSNTATQSTTLGQIELTIGTSLVTAQNFGIEQTPTPGSGTNTVANAGGTSSVPVPASTFTNTSPGTDTAPGSVTAIRITSFPGNVTSLTINGTVYNAGNFPGAGVTVPADGSGNPTQPIAVDPTNDGANVVIPFVVIDNAGKESSTTGTATITSSLPTTVAVSGTVWNDADGNIALNGSETGTNTGGTLYVNLVDGTGTVVGSTTVATNGSYSLTGVPANVTGYKLVLTNSASSNTPGTLPTGWVNTGENVDPSNPATQTTTLGQIELTIGTGAVTAQNFGIEQLPSPGSGTATAANSGGSSPVTVPPTAFTSTSPSTDVTPGNVTAIRITGFPTNVTSLTINGVVYTPTSPEFSGPTPTGVPVPTTSTGAPTVPILVDPTNDSQPVVFTFKAVDNAGKQSMTTGTATLGAAPDLTPIIYARPSTVYNTTPITVVVDVLELLSVPTSGTIVVKVTKDALASLVFPPTATMIGDKSVQNSVWSINSVTDPNYYILTTSQVVAAGDKLSFGFTGVLTPGATTGTLTLSSVIMAGSGGEVKFNNNVDADKIDYFQQ